VTDRLKCKTPGCERTILPDTAQRTGGLCMPCIRAAVLKEREAFLKNRPAPSQGSLDVLLSTATRLRVLEGGVRDDKAIGRNVLLDSCDASAVSKIARLLRIVEDPITFGHCMCAGSYALEFYDGQTILATIGLHHGRSIRWHGWQWDACLCDAPGLLDGLNQLGVSGPLAELTEAYKRTEERQRAGERSHVVSEHIPSLHTWKDDVLEYAQMILFAPIWMPLALIDNLRLRARTRPLVSGRVEEAWTRCAVVWQKEGLLCQCAPHVRASFGHELAVALARQHSKEAAFFLRKVADPDPLLAAYAFKCLIRVVKPCREDLPAGALQRSETIQVQWADHVWEETISAYLEGWFREQDTRP
jgi:hypothetical protein